MSAEEGNAPTGQATAPAPATKPAKDPKRVSAGKAAAQKTKEAREAKKKALADAEERAKKAEEKAARAAKKEPAAAPNPVGRPAEEEKPESDSEGLNTTQWLTLGSIAVGLIGIYYKREELKAVFKNGGQNRQTVLTAQSGNCSSTRSGDCYAQRLSSNGMSHLNFVNFLYHTMSDNKLVKTILDVATLTGFAAGIGWALKELAKENFTEDPSASPMNYARFTAVMVGSIALKQYLTDHKILPDNI